MGAWKKELNKAVVIGATALSAGAMTGCEIQVRQTTPEQDAAFERARKVVGWKSTEYGYYTTQGDRVQNTMSKLSNQAAVMFASYEPYLNSSDTKVVESTMIYALLTHYKHAHTTEVFDADRTCTEVDPYFRQPQGIIRSSRSLQFMNVGELWMLSAIKRYNIPLDETMVELAKISETPIVAQHIERMYLRQRLAEKNESAALPSSNAADSLNALADRMIKDNTDPVLIKEIQDAAKLTDQLQVQRYFLKKYHEQAQDTASVQSR